MKSVKLAAVLMIAGLGASLVGAQVAQVDTAIPSYQRGAALSGNLSSVGSDSMLNLMTYWAEGFARLYPGVKIQIEGKGSSTAPPALIAGTAQLGPMSREMKDSELDAIEQKYGFQPTQIRSSIDVLGVFVNKDNPIASLTLPEVDAVFSKTRKGGFGKNITTWGQLGLKGAWAPRPISIFGRNAASGTYGFFKENALYKGDYKDTVKEQPGSASVVQGVSEDMAAIGYSGIGYRTSGVRALPLAARAGEQAYEPNYENALSLKYPLTRYLLIYVVADPRKAMDPLTREFLKYVLSKEGQEVVIKDGYLPLPAAMVQQELGKLR
ncbi:MAG TPA: phosphate ABC transporter substrate-binding protein [Thermoanaerobaculaceae bacterium]|nr:phosphate ABC transporter substrate-binding protein [Thermoanaerobaculaceae bacterium]